MNKAVSFLLTILLAFTLISTMQPIAVHAAVGVEFTDVGSGLKFEVLTEGSGSGTVQVKADSYSGTTYTVPETVSNGGIDYTVIGIGYEAFKSSSLSAIVLPDSVTYIGNFAFEGCSNLTSVDIPDSVTIAGISTFAGSGLTSITIPENITEIDDWAFSGCSNLASVTFLGIKPPATLYSTAFSGNPAMTVTVPAGTTEEYEFLKQQGKLPSNANITAAAASITGVTVSPPSVEVERGETVTFSAIVSGSGSYGPAVQWNVNSSSSAITANGVLSVSETEPASVLTVTAISMADPNVSGKTTVTVKPIALQEKFCLAVGSTCYFDLSSISVNTPSAITNSAIPDINLKWVPFTYVGTINAYSLNAGTSGVTSASITAAANASNRSLFLADHVLYLNVSWNELNGAGLIFGKSYSENGVSYLLRSLSGGSNVSTPSSNEWNQILVKRNYIRNYDSYSWCQDTFLYSSSRRIMRGGSNASYWDYDSALARYSDTGNRPALEILNAGSLSSDALKTVTYKMGANGTLGSGTLTAAAVVYTGELTLPEITSANGFKYTGATEAGKVLGWYNGSVFYTAGTKLSSLPSGTVLTAGYGVPKYALTITAGTGGTITTGNSDYYDAGTVINISATSSAVYSFNQWTSTGGGIFGSTASAVTTFTMPANAATVTAIFTANPVSGGGSGSGGGGGVGGSSTSAPPSKPETSGNTTTITTATTATVDGSGRAAAAVTKDQLSAAVNSAVTEAKKQGDGTAAVVEIKVDAPANSNSVETGIPKDALGLAVTGGTDALKISTPVASISFDTDALSGINKEASGDVKITAAKVGTSSLTEDIKQLVGERPVFNFSVTSGNNTISQFGGNVTVAVPYTPKADEDTDAIVIYYINSEGKPEAVANCKYDPATKTVSFTTSHFSRYAVGYNKVSFSDVKAGAWYRNAVEFTAARGIVTGTGKGNFNPDGKLTRGQLLVMLMRAYGIEPAADLSNNFSDAGNTYYTGYLSSAKHLGITEGLGNNLYAPDKQITRQEMFALLYNTLKVIGQLPEGTRKTSGALKGYADADSIAYWAKDAAVALADEKIIGGNNGKLSPKNPTTRAEMAQILYNLLSK